MVRPVLLDLQHGRCFSCNRGIIEETAHVDHFVAWPDTPWIWLTTSCGRVQSGCAVGVRADGGSARVNMAARGRDGAAGGGVAGLNPFVTETAPGQSGRFPALRTAGGAGFDVWTKLA